MASYHLAVKALSRSPAGRTAPAAAAYRSGTLIVNERDNRINDYRRRANGVEAAFIIAPDGTDWAQDRALVWNRAEAAEKRKDAKVAREVEIAIAWEVRPEDRETLVREFASEIVRRHGVIADVAIHKPHWHGDPRNWHAHVLLTTRRATVDGLGEKTRELDDPRTGGPAIESLRELWAEMQNRRLEQAGVAERVDHRSFERRGMPLVPMQHLGPSAAAIERLAGTDEREAARTAGIPRPDPTGPGASLPPAGVANAASVAVTGAGRRNTQIQAENAPVRQAAQAREAEIAAMRAEVARLAAELRVEEAHEARVEQIVAAARMDQARARLGIAKRGGPGLPPHLRAYGLDAAAARGIALTGAASAPTLDAEILAAPSSRPSAARRRQNADSRSVRPRPAQSHTDEIAAAAPVAASDVGRAAALDASIAAVRTAWGKAPRTNDGQGIVMHWREALWHPDQQAADTQTKNLAHTIGLPDVLVSRARGHHTAHINFAMLGAYREALPTNERRRFSTDLADAARASSWTYLAEWSYEKFGGRLASNLSVSERLLESTMAATLGLPSPSLTEIINSSSAASIARTASTSKMPEVTSQPSAPSVTSDRRKTVNIAAEAPAPIQAGVPPTTPAAVASAQDGKSSSRTQNTTNAPNADPIGTAAADTLLANSGIVYVNAIGEAEVVLAIRGTPENRRPSDAPDDWDTIRPLLSMRSSIMPHRLQRVTWSIVRLHITDAATAIGTKSRGVATKLIEELKRLNEAGSAVRDGAEASSRNLGRDTDKPAAGSASTGASRGAQSGTKIDEPIGAAAADKLLVGAGLIYVNGAGEAELVINVAGDANNRRPAGEWDPWNAVKPFWSNVVTNRKHMLHGLTWNTVRMRAVDVATTIGRRTHDGAMSLVNNLRRANDGGNAVKHRAETLAEARQANNAARAEARATEEARIHAAGEVAVAAARARQAEVAAARGRQAEADMAAARARQAAEAADPGLSRQRGPGQPSKPKRRGRGRPPKGRGMGF